MSDPYAAFSSPVSAPTSSSDPYASFSSPVQHQSGGDPYAAFSSPVGNVPQKKDPGYTLNPADTDWNHGLGGYLKGAWDNSVGAAVQSINQDAQTARRNFDKRMTAGVPNPVQAVKNSAQDIGNSVKSAVDVGMAPIQETFGLGQQLLLNRPTAGILHAVGAPTAGLKSDFHPNLHNLDWGTPTMSPIQTTPDQQADALWNTAMWGFKPTAGGPIRSTVLGGKVAPIDLPPTASAFVKGLFDQRGKDTTPVADPTTPPVQPTMDARTHSTVNPDFNPPVHDLTNSQNVMHYASNSYPVADHPVQDLTNAQDHGPNYYPSESEPVQDLTNAHEPEPAPTPVENPQRAVQRDTVQGHIDDISKNWKNKPDVNVVHSEDALTGDDPNLARAAQDPRNLGVFNTKTNQIHIFQDRVNGPADVASVLFHEALGHYGLAQKFGTDLRALLTTMDQRNVGKFSDEVTKKQNQYNKGLKPDHPDYIDRTTAAEEVLAKWSENGPLPTNMFDAVKAHIKRFARKMGMDLSYSDPEIRTILSMAHDAVINGKKSVRENNFRRSPLVLGDEGDLRRMYVGEQAADHDHFYGLNYDDLVADGLDPDKAREITGYFRGPDGHMRREISDAGTHSKLPTKVGERVPLDQVIHHPALFKAYPEFTHGGITVSRERMPGLEGAYYPSLRHIAIDTVAHNPHSTLLHEIQHAVQHYEGHPNGGSSDSVLESMTDHQLLDVSNKIVGDFNQRITALEGALNRARPLHPKLRELYENELAEIKAQKEKLLNSNNFEEFNDAIPRSAKQELYRRIFGEVEARDTQARMHMSDAERRRFAPYTSEPKPEGGYLVMKPGDEHPTMASEHTVFEANPANENVDVDHYFGSAADHFYSGEFNRGMKSIDPKFHFETLEAFYNATEGVKKAMPEVDKSVLDRLDHLTDAAATAVEDGHSTELPFKRIDSYLRAMAHGSPDLYKSLIEHWEYAINDEFDRQFHSAQEYKPSSFPLNPPALEAANQGKGSILERIADTIKKPEADDTDNVRFMRRDDDYGHEDRQIRALEAVYETLGEEYDPGKRDWEMVRRAALAAGTKPSQIRDLASLKKLDERMFRVGVATQKAEDALMDIYTRMGTPDERITDQIDAADKLADFKYFLGRLAEDSAEHSRALNIKKRIGYTQNQVEDIAELFRQLRENGGDLSELGDRDTYVRFMKQLAALRQSGNKAGVQSLLTTVASKPYWWQYALTLRQNMMLSGLSTHAKEFSDMATSGLRDFEEHVASLPLGTLRELANHIPGVNLKTGTHVTDITAGISGLMQAAVDANTWKDTWTALKHGFGNQPNATMVPQPQMRDMFKGPIKKAVTGMLDVPTNVTAGLDTFFRAFMHNANLRVLANREAYTELKAASNNGKVRWSDVMALGESKALNPTPEMLDESHEMANQTILMNKSPINSLIGQAKAIRPRMTPLQQFGSFTANLLTTFARIKANAFMNQVIRRSPLALLDPRTVADLKAGGSRADIAVTRAIMGTLLMAGYWNAADPKNQKQQLTGSAPESYAKLKAMEGNGWRPDANQGNGQYQTGNQLNFSVNPFDQHNHVAVMIKDLRQAYEKGAQAKDVVTGLKLASYSLIHEFSESTFASDLEPALDTFTAQGETFGKKAQKFAADEARTFLPNLTTQMAKVIDPIQRDTGGTVKGALQAAIPGQSQNLPAKYSVYGEPMQTGTTMEGIHLPDVPGTNIPNLHGNHTTESTDPTIQELHRLEEGSDKTVVGPVEKTMRFKVNMGDHQAEVGLKLTPEQFETYQRAAGQTLVHQISLAMQSPSWDQKSDAQRIAYVKNMETQSKKAVRKALLQQQDWITPDQLEDLRKQVNVK